MKMSSVKSKLVIGMVSDSDVGLTKIFWNKIEGRHGQPLANLISGVRFAHIALSQTKSRYGQIKTASVSLHIRP